MTKPLTDKQIQTIFAIAHMGNGNAFDAASAQILVTRKLARTTNLFNVRTQPSFKLTLLGCNVLESLINDNASRTSKA
jgi:hypothetical protein